MFFASLLVGLQAHAQKTGTNKRAQQIMDSTRKAQEALRAAQQKERERITDSTKTARARIADSTKASRERMADSVAKVRARKADSLADIRKYKDSRRYRDSVTRARERVADSIKQERQLVLDAQKAERQAITDSIVAVRKAALDSTRAVQKQRSDSLELVRKYKESKRYRDSVGIVRQNRMDSITAMRKHVNDSISAYRKHLTDSATASRKAILDSTMAVRKAAADSMTAVRKARADSLLVVKEKRDKLRKQEEDKKIKKMNLALELKMKKKQSEWTNEKMLKKKWSAPRQLVQNTFTRYNYYFNARNKMAEAHANMERVVRENYDTMIALYPFNPNRDSSLMAADMDSIISKVSVGIQIHDPRTKWGDDLYLLLGEAYYFKGDYKNASIAFRYIIGMDKRNKKKKGSSGGYARRSKEQASILEEDKETALDFLKHKSVNNDAILWLSRTFTQAGQPENGEAVIDLVASDPKFPENLKGKLAMARAFLMLYNNNIKEASDQLKIAANDEYLTKEQRQRAAYLNGQILQQDGNYAAATESFQKTLDLHPNIDMDFYARKNIAFNTMYSGNGQEQAIASLKKILKDYKYLSYYEQVYYLLGRLAANSGSSSDAIAYLQKSTASAKSTKKQKAISFATMGNIYYREGDYIAAKSAYDSSALLAKNAPDDKDVIEAVRRSQALDAVTGPYTIIKTQDSLLALASMSEKEQRAAVRKYLRELERQRQDSIFNAENAGLNNLVQNDNVNMQQGGGGAGWYFSNPTQMKKGQSEFKRLWGNRPLVDNWRRTSAIGFVSNGANNNNDNADETSIDENGVELDANGFPTEQSLLAGLPTTPERQARANKLMQKAYLDLGDAYVMNLEDYQLAGKALDTLVVRYPQHEDKPREIYLRYIMAMRQNKMQDAQRYSQQLQQQFPNSQYAALVKPTEDGNNLYNTAPGKEGVANYYDATYSLLLQRQYTEVLERIKTARQQYKDPRYEKRFRVMEGVALAGSGKTEQADTLLRDFIKANATDTLRPWAEAVLEYIAKDKPKTPVPDTANTGTAKPLPQVTNTTINTNTDIDGNVTIAQPSGEVPKIFAYKPEKQHFLLFSFPGMQGRAMGVKSAIGDFNNFRYKEESLSTGIDMLSKTEGVVYVKKFTNAAKAKDYMTALRAASQIFREYQTSEYQLFIISEDNYQKLLSDHSTQAYLNFYKFYYK